jgi:O-antigen ligase
LGSGYSTLTKEQVTDFTEAESTDNDYLRALGETGLLGLVSFYGIFIFALYQAYRRFTKVKTVLESAYLAAFIAILIGLLVNALYIDIFEASKVAYLLWAFMGVSFGLMALKKPSPS